MTRRDHGPLIRRLYPASPRGVVAMTADGPLHIDYPTGRVTPVEPRWRLTPQGHTIADVPWIDGPVGRPRRERRGAR